MNHLAATIPLWENKSLLSHIKSIKSDALMSYIWYNSLWFQRPPSCVWKFWWTAEPLNSRWLKAFSSCVGPTQSWISLQTADFFSASHAVKSASFYAMNQQQQGHESAGETKSQSAVPPDNEIDQSHREERCSSNARCNETLRTGAYQHTLTWLSWMHCIWWVDL